MKEMLCIGSKSQELISRENCLTDVHNTGPVHGTSHNRL